MNEDQRKAYDFAADAAKQIISLSTAIIAVSVTLAGDKLKNGSSTMLTVTWGLFLLAIFFGIWMLLGLTGNMAKSAPDIYSTNIRLPWFLQISCFLLALIMTIRVGWYSVKQDKDKDEKIEKIIIKSRSAAHESTTDTIIYQHE